MLVTPQLERAVQAAGNEGEHLLHLCRASAVAIRPEAFPQPRAGGAALTQCHDRRHSSVQFRQQAPALDDRLLDADDNQAASADGMRRLCDETASSMDRKTSDDARGLTCADREV